MTLENIEVGLRVPNYKKLCELLDEDVKNGGTSKRAQLKEWERFFTYERDKNAFIIKEIFDAPKQKSDNRMRFMQYSEPILLHYLWQWSSDSSEINKTFRNWGIDLGIVSPSIYDDEQQNYWIDSTLFTPLEVHRAVNMVEQKTKEIIVSTAEALQKRGIINLSIRTYIIDFPVHRIASKEEKNTIANIKKRVMTEMGCQNMFSISISPKRNREFYEKVNDIYKKEYGWTSSYTTLAISVTNISLLQQYENINVIELQNKLRKEIQASLRGKLQKEVELGNIRSLENLENCNNSEWVMHSFCMNNIMAADIMFIIEELM